MERPLNLGVVGASGIALRRMLPALRAQAEDLPIRLGAVCSRSMERARTIAGDDPGARAFDDYPRMLAEAELDAIYVASPVHCHLDHASRALRAGKALLCEKPAGRTVAECEAIAGIATRTGVAAMEAYMMNFHPAHRRLREEIAQGRYGRIVSARARFSCWYPGMSSAWRQDPALGGGGALIDLGSHLLSLLLWLLGPIERLKAACSNRVFDYRVEDDAVLVCELQSGARATLECSFCLPDATPSLLEICGTEGWAFLEGTLGQEGGGRGRKSVACGQAAYEPLQSGSRIQSETEQGELFAPVNLYAAQLRAFATAVLDKQAPRFNTLSEGVEVMRWITEAYRQTGRLT